MRLSSSILVSLAVLCAPTSASAQQAYNMTSPAILGDGARYPLWGTCQIAEPNVAIPDCTRLLDRGIYPQSDRVVAYNLRAIAYLKTENFELALADYNEAINLDTGNVWSLIGRARIMATAPEPVLRDGQQAVSDALSAIELHRNSARPERRWLRLQERRARAQSTTPSIFLDTLASAYAENGEFETAVDSQQRAIASLQAGDGEAIVDYQNRLDLYLQGMPYRHMSKVE
jgi:tetratricopeptide (TPR) repeat protein